MQSRCCSFLAHPAAKNSTSPDPLLTQIKTLLRNSGGQGSRKKDMKLWSRMKKGSVKKNLENLCTQMGKAEIFVPNVDATAVPMPRYLPFTTQATRCTWLRHPGTLIAYLSQDHPVCLIHVQGQIPLMLLTIWPRTRRCPQLLPIQFHGQIVFKQTTFNHTRQQFRGTQYPRHHLSGAQCNHCLRYLWEMWVRAVLAGPITQLSRMSPTTNLTNSATSHSSVKIRVWLND